MRKYSTLIWAGGLLDQPAFTWEVVTTLGEWWDSVISGETQVEDLMSDDDEDEEDGESTRMATSRPGESEPIR